MSLFEHRVGPGVPGWHPEAAEAEFGFGLRFAVVYCCTAWETASGGLAELRATSELFGAAAGMRVEAWCAEVVPDHVECRNTDLLRLAIDYTANSLFGFLLIAESPTMVRTAGRAVVLAQSAGLEPRRVITVPGSAPRPLGP